MPKLKACKHCEQEGHTAFVCPRKPRTTLKPKKKIKRVGKMAQQYFDLRKEYLAAHPAPHYCYYCIYVGIEEALFEANVQVEHYHTKNTHPELRLDWANIVKSCPTHNTLKGSMDGDDFLKILDKQMEIKTCKPQQVPKR